MSKLIKQTRGEVISWQEIEEMVDNMLSLAYANIQGFNSIWYSNFDAIIPAALMAHRAHIPLVPTGTVFGLFDTDPKADISFYKYIHESDHFTSKKRLYLYDIGVDIEGNYKRITFPWEV